MCVLMEGDEVAGGQRLGWDRSCGMTQSVSKAMGFAQFIHVVQGAVIDSQITYFSLQLLQTEEPIDLHES